MVKCVHLSVTGGSVPTIDTPYFSLFVLLVGEWGNGEVRGRVPRFHAHACSVPPIPARSSLSLWAAPSPWNFPPLPLTLNLILSDTAWVTMPCLGNTLPGGSGVISPWHRHTILREGITPKRQAAGRAGTNLPRRTGCVRFSKKCGVFATLFRSFSWKLYPCVLDGRKVQAT
jgi:hypothetical protein